MISLSQMLQRLPTLLAQSKTGNSFIGLQNKSCYVAHLFDRDKQIKALQHNSIQNNGLNVTPLSQILQRLPVLLDAGKSKI